MSGFMCVYFFWWIVFLCVCINIYLLVNNAFLYNKKKCISLYNKRWKQATRFQGIQKLCHINRTRTNFKSILLTEVRHGKAAGNEIKLGRKDALSYFYDYSSHIKTIKSIYKCILLVYIENQDQEYLILSLSVGAPCILKLASLSQLKKKKNQFNTF